MKLNKHIAYRFLTDDKFAWEITEHQHPDYFNGNTDEKVKELTANTYDLVNNQKQTAYYVTETVLDKLDLLKVSKGTAYPIISQYNKKEEIGEVTTYNWDVFNTVSNRKVTFIFPNQRLLRIQFVAGYISLFDLRCDAFDWDRNHAEIYWTMAWVDVNRHRISANWKDKDIQAAEEFIYKLLCFIYLSENEEIIVQPGGKHGTRKSGKLINPFTIPVTIVNSKWNVTSIRTEGFDVSGHFRLQPTNAGTKMIFIQPFRKHGYVRRAKNEDNT